MKREPINGQIAVATEAINCHSLTELQKGK